MSLRSFFHRYSPSLSPSLSLLAFTLILQFLCLLDHFSTNTLPLSLSPSLSLSIYFDSAIFMSLRSFFHKYSPSLSLSFSLSIYFDSAIFMSLRSFFHKYSVSSLSLSLSLSIYFDSAIFMSLRSFFHRYSPSLSPSLFLLAFTLIQQFLCLLDHFSISTTSLSLSLSLCLSLS